MPTKHQATLRRWSLTGRILAHLAKVGDSGATADEVHTGIEEKKRMSSVAATILRLVKEGLVLATDEKRTTKTGKEATVYVKRSP